MKDNTNFRGGQVAQLQTLPHDLKRMLRVQIKELVHFVEDNEVECNAVEFGAFNVALVPTVVDSRNKRRAA